jgi:hypothetical protein
MRMCGCGCTRLGEMQGHQNRTSGQTWRMPKSMLPKEWRRGPVLEPAGTLAITRKMLLPAGEGKATLHDPHPLGGSCKAGRRGRRRSHSGCRCRRVLTPNRCGVAVFRSRSAFLALAFLGVTPTDTRNAGRCKSSVSRWISVSVLGPPPAQVPLLPKGWRHGPVVLAGTPVTTWMMPMS